MEYPSLDKLKSDITNIQELCKKENFMAGIFSRQDEHDKTIVFDYINEKWYQYIYECMRNAGENDYFEDQSPAYKISYCCVEINLRHALVNANKRSSLLAFFILIIYNFWEKFFNLDWDFLYSFAKETAKGGEKERKQNIQKLKNYLLQIIK